MQIDIDQYRCIANLTMINHHRNSRLLRILSSNFVHLILVFECNSELIPALLTTLSRIFFFIIILFEISVFIRYDFGGVSWQQLTAHRSSITDPEESP